MNDAAFLLFWVVIYLTIPLVALGLVARDLRRGRGRSTTRDAWSLAGLIGVLIVIPVVLVLIPWPAD